MESVRACEAFKIDEKGAARENIRRPPGERLKELKNKYKGKSWN